MIEVKGANISVRSGDGEPSVGIQLRLLGFRSIDEAKRFLEFVTKRAILDFQGQKTLQETISE